MKLLQLNVTANWGSTGKIAEGIGQAAMTRGWESYIAFGRSSNPSHSRAIKIGSLKDVYFHYAKHRLLNCEGHGSRHATKELIKKIEILQPDIIHLHNIHDHWLNYPILFRYLATIDTPIVWTFHDCWAFTGGCPHFEALGCGKWKTGCFQCQQTMHFQLDRSRQNYELKKTLFQALGSRLTIVCVSEWLAQYVRQSFLRCCRINIINNGIDLSTFTPKETAEKRRMILGVSNVWPDYKGLPDFIHLHDILPKNIEMVLVGLSKNQIKNLPKGISGRERTSNIEELVNLYRSAMAFVNPTYNDSFPTVNLEALACGTPVITYRTGGSPEAVDEKTGIVIEQGDIGALANAVKSIASGSIEFDSDLCRQRAVENFNQETQFNKYIDLYESLLSKKQ